MTSNRNLFLLTTPHSYCTPDDTARHHMCDLAVPALAKNIYREQQQEKTKQKNETIWFLRKEKTLPNQYIQNIVENVSKYIHPFDFVWLQPQIHRSIYDMNRETSRQSEFRKQLKKLVEQYKSNHIVNLDLHSYPSYTKDFGKYDIVFLLFESQKKDERTIKLIEMLQQLKFKVGILTADLANDIMKTHLDLGIYTILLEINERLSGHRQQEIVEVLGRWMKDVLYIS